MIVTELEMIHKYQVEQETYNMRKINKELMNELALEVMTSLQETPSIDVPSINRYVKQLTAGYVNTKDVVRE